MRSPRFVLLLVLLSLIAAAPMRAANARPFKGAWSGVTVSADATHPPVVSIVAEGTGQLTHLGRYFMTSPHTTDVSTGETIGDQIFTAANGDTLTAFCAGFPNFQPSGNVEGALECNITSGTGRFAGATGSYEFFLVARPLADGSGFATDATITGSIVY
jgi:hypothetical protein